MLAINKPDYCFVKLRPNNSIRNNNTHLITKSIANMHSSVFRNLKVTRRKTFSLFKKEITIPTKFEYDLTGKISFFVYMEKDKIEFYFIFPERVKQVFHEKLSSVWHLVTIDYINEEELPTFSEKATKYSMEYVKEDGLSLHTNRSSNDLLNATLNVVESIEEGDKVAVFYNFIPTNQNSFRHSYRHTIEKIQKRQPVDRNKTGLSYLFKASLSIVDGILKDIGEVLAGKNEKLDDQNILTNFLEQLNGGGKISESTERKGRTQIVESQILILSESKVKVRELSYATSIADAFEVISADNRFERKRYNKKFNYRDTRYSTKSTNKISDEEAQNFIALPGRELLEAYSFMDKVETQETQLPKELQQGTMCIGSTTYRGHTQKAYLSDDEQFKKLMLLLIGPTRAGKSKLIANLSADAIRNKECVIIFDFIKKCELSSEIAACFPADKVLEIACDDFDKMQGIGYNEVGYTADTFKQYENAKRQTSNTLTLINALNDRGEGSRLSAKMERFLESACLVVYITGGSMKEVFSVLMNHCTRHDFINKIPSKFNQFLDEYIASLHELDEVDKEGAIIGTRLQAGIIDRLNTLKRNTYMELMLKKGTENNIDLSEEMQKNQLIVIKMPQNMFTTDSEKDIFTTYWMSKIWLALQVRADKYDEDKLTKVNLVIDELYQVEHTEQFLKSKLSQVAKFGMKPIVSCHYISQLKHLRTELAGANASYMLIAGCDKKNFEELKNDLYPYTADDLKNLKRFHSLNLIKTQDGHAQFITHLPPVLKPDEAEPDSSSATSLILTKESHSL